MINRTPSQVLDGKTPYELLHGAAPVYSVLRVFGCLAYAHRRSRDKDKFGERSRQCIFVGYPFGKKAWRLYDLETMNFLRAVMSSSSNINFLVSITPRMSHL